jgi:hypothetical protein
MDWILDGRVLEEPSAFQTHHDPWQPVKLDFQATNGGRLLQYELEYTELSSNISASVRIEQGHDA